MGNTGSKTMATPAVSIQHRNSTSKSRKRSSKNKNSQKKKLLKTDVNLDSKTPQDAKRKPDVSSLETPRPATLDLATFNSVKFKDAAHNIWKRRVEQNRPAKLHSVPGTTIWDLYAIPEDLLPLDYVRLIYLEAGQSLFRGKPRENANSNNNVEFKPKNIQKRGKIISDKATKYASLPVHKPTIVTNPAKRMTSMTSSLGSKYTLKNSKNQNFRDNPVVGKKLASHVLYIYDKNDPGENNAQKMQIPCQNGVVNSIENGVDLERSKILTEMKAFQPYDEIYPPYHDNSFLSEKYDYEKSECTESISNTLPLTEPIYDNMLFVPQKQTYPDYANTFYPMMPENLEGLKVKISSSGSEHRIDTENSFENEISIANDNENHSSKKLRLQSQESSIIVLEMAKLRETCMNSESIVTPSPSSDRMFILPENGNFDDTVGTLDHKFGTLDNQFSTLGTVDYSTTMEQEKLFHEVHTMNGIEESPRSPESPESSIKPIHKVSQKPMSTEPPSERNAKSCQPTSQIFEETASDEFLLGLPESSCTAASPFETGMMHAFDVKMQEIHGSPIFESSKTGTNFKFKISNGPVEVPSFHDLIGFRRKQLRQMGRLEESENESTVFSMTPQHSRNPSRLVSEYSSESDFQQDQPNNQLPTNQSTKSTTPRKPHYNTSSKRLASLSSLAHTSSSSFGKMKCASQGTTHFSNPELNRFKKSLLKTALEPKKQQVFKSAFEELMGKKENKNYGDKFEENGAESKILANFFNFHSKSRSHNNTPKLPLIKPMLFVVEEDDENTTTD